MRHERLLLPLAQGVAAVPPPALSPQEPVSLGRLSWTLHLRFSLARVLQDGGGGLGEGPENTGSRLVRAGLLESHRFIWPTH